MTNHIPQPPPRWVKRRIRRCLQYLPDTGKLIWIARSGRGSHIKVGDEAGNRDAQGYSKITFSRRGKKRTIAGHHIAWFLHHRVWPTQEIDHRNNKKVDNRIRNLRACNHGKNTRNKNHPKGSTGVTGIWLRENGRFRAVITKQRRHITLGTFDTLKEAKHARRQAEKKYFGRWRYQQQVN